MRCDCMCSRAMWSRDRLHVYLERGADSESRLPLRSGESSLFGALVRQLLFTDERSCAAAVAISHQPCRVNQELALHALNQRPVAAAHTTRCSPTKRETRRGCAAPRASARTVGHQPLPNAALPAPIPCRPPRPFLAYAAHDFVRPRHGLPLLCARRQVAAEGEDRIVSGANATYNSVWHAAFARGDALGGRAVGAVRPAVRLAGSWRVQGAAGALRSGQGVCSRAQRPMEVAHALSSTQICHLCVPCELFVRSQGASGSSLACNRSSHTPTLARSRTPHYCS